MKSYADKKHAHNKNVFTPGDQVLSKNFHRQNKSAPYFEPEPYTVVEVFSHSVKIQNKIRTTVRHNTHVKPFIVSKNNAPEPIIDEVSTSPMNTLLIPMNTLLIPRNTLLIPMISLPPDSNSDTDDSNSETDSDSETNYNVESTDSIVTSDTIPYEEEEEEEEGRRPKRKVKRPTKLDNYELTF